jgi:hypothetical protein
VHFAAGPWFTVFEESNQWNELGTIWLANGKQNRRAYVQYRVQLSAESAQTTTAEVSHES